LQALRAGMFARNVAIPAIKSVCRQTPCFSAHIRKFPASWSKVAARQQAHYPCALRRSGNSASGAVFVKHCDQELAMKKILSGMMLLLMTLPALADETPPPLPRVDADPTGLIVFAVLLVAMIGGFAAYIWVKERARNNAAK
jgi:hypothetical protein